MFYLRCFFRSCFLIFVSIFLTRKENMIAFGSWGGKFLIDNSFYLARYIKNLFPNYLVYWVGEKNLKEMCEENGFIFLEKNTFSSDFRLLRCKYLFFSQMPNDDISASNVYVKSITCYLHHGMPIKKWGNDAIGFKKRCSIFRKIYKAITGISIHFNFFATSSELHDKSNLTSLSSRGCTDKKNLKCGTPRNDFLINITMEEKKRIVETLNNKLGISRDKKVILYLPTFRRKSENIFSFCNIGNESLDKLNYILEKNNAIIIEKSHIAEKKLKRNENNSRNIIALDASINVQELYLISDCLISDYSGAFLDDLFLDKPIIHFVYDYDYYKEVDSGLYYPIEEFAAGPVAYDFVALAKTINIVLQQKDLYVERRKYIKERYMSYEQGNACRLIFNKVIMKKADADS